jgi:membrane protease YdiL (CAAX protease family)
MITPEQLWTKAEPTGVMGRVIQWPLARSVVAVLFLAAVVMVHNVYTIFGLEKIPDPYFSYVLDIETVLLVAVLLYVYSRYARLVEKRPALEISGDRSVPEALGGFAIGGGLVAFQVAILAGFGYYGIESVGRAPVLLHAFFTFAIGAFLQEFLFRGILFRNLEELLGSWLALGVIAALFGALHFGNENATLWTSTALMLSDLVLTGAYMLTRRIWLVWGIHTGWNFIQDGVFGMSNSGITSLKSWIKPVVDGPYWLTGGTFGIEASYLAILLAVAVGLIFLRRAATTGRTVRPSWMRR